MGVNVKTILEERKFIDPMYAEQADAVKKAVKEHIGRDKAIPVDGVKRKGKNDKALEFAAAREIAINLVAKVCFPIACSELKVIKSEDFTKEDGKSFISKADATTLVNDIYSGVQLHQDIRGFIIFILNETYSTDQGFDLGDLSLEEGSDLKMAKQRVSHAQSVCTLPLQKREIARITSPATKKAAEAQVGYVQCSPQNALAVIMSADVSKRDTRSSVGWDVKLSDPKILALDARKRATWCFRHWLLDKYRIQKLEGISDFNLMDYITDFPSKTLNVAYKSDPANFMKAQATACDTKGHLI